MARIMTVCTTCRSQGRNVLDYLTAAIQAYANNQAAPSLLPVSPELEINAAA